MNDDDLGVKKFLKLKDGSMHEMHPDMLSICRTGSVELFWGWPVSNTLILVSWIPIWLFHAAEDLDFIIWQQKGHLHFVFTQFGRKTRYYHWINLHVFSHSLIWNRPWQHSFELWHGQVANFHNCRDELLFWGIFTLTCPPSPTYSTFSA